MEGDDKMISFHFYCCVAWVFGRGFLSFLKGWFLPKEAEARSISSRSKGRVRMPGVARRGSACACAS